MKENNTPHPPIQKNVDDVNEKLQRLLTTQSRIKQNKSKPISFKNPILWQKENPVFFPNTINVIQGKAGVHKSRLAETICASLLKLPESNKDLLNFNMDPAQKYAVCYVDTERNLSDQFPYSLQQIQLKAGYNIEDDPHGFDYISLLEFGREERFDMLDVYLEHIRKQFPMHIFIVLDVITDCVFNFNDSNDSMKLIDMMNRTINHYDVTFICLIHENPGNSDKARGHLGTEILNKASTVIQIAFEKDLSKKNLDFLKIAYLKCRNSKLHDPFHAKYSDLEKGLILADPADVQAILDKKNHKAMFSEIIHILSEILTDEMSRKDLLEYITDELDCSKRTVMRRLKQIINDRSAIQQNGSNYVLATRSKQKEIIYYLKLSGSNK